MCKGEVSLVTVKEPKLLQGKPLTEVPSGGPVVFKLEMIDFGRLKQQISPRFHIVSWVLLQAPLR